MLHKLDELGALAHYPQPLSIARREAAAAEPWAGRWRAVIRQVAIAGDDRVKNALIERFIEGSGVRTLGFINAHALNLCVGDVRFAADLLSTDLLMRDGIGVKALYRLAGWKAGLNLNGTDLLPQIFPYFAGRPIALFGTRAEVVGKVAAYMEQSLGSDILTADGFQPEHDYVDRVRRDQPALVILGMGMPKQERVARLMRDLLRQDVAVICGGAILDFLSGHVPRAPAWMRRAGMEWLYRFNREPRRLFRRYLIGNPLFLARSAMLAAEERWNAVLEIAGLELDRETGNI